MRAVLGFALCGSFCTFEKALEALRKLAAEYKVIPIMSENAAALDTRFGKAEDFISEITSVCACPPLTTLVQVEPIGPGNMLDALVVAPCTGNTLAKLAGGIADTLVTMAAKSQPRNGRPVAPAVSINDGLAAAAVNIGTLLARKHIYFVPFGQDDPEGKPTSLVADMTLLPAAVKEALAGRQLQPLLLGPK